MQNPPRPAGSLFRLPKLFGREAPSVAPVPQAIPPAPVSQPAKPTPKGETTPTFFLVRTAQGRHLCLDRIPTCRLATAAVLDPATAVIAVMPTATRRECLLLSQDTEIFEVPPDQASGVACAARALQTDARGVVRLQHPLGGTFLTADDAGGVRFDAAGVSPQDAFTLVPASETDLSAGLLAHAREIGRAAAAGWRAQPMLEALRRGLLRPELAEAMLRLLPQAELDDLARRALDSAEDLALLRRLMPDDPWIKTALCGLADWQITRTPVTQLASPPADEAMLLPEPNNGRLQRTGLPLVSLARRHILPRRGACVLAAARNEGPYLLDWISYHLSIGFEHLFLYTNGNEDGSDALLAALAAQGAITWISNECGHHMGPQTKAYAHALRMLPHILDFRWAAIIDLDEYIGFDADIFDGINDYIGLQEVQPTDAIGLCWLFFAGLPEDRWSPQSSLARFSLRDSLVNMHVKSIVRPRLFWDSQPHFPYASLGGLFNFRTEDGRLHHHAGEFGRQAAFAEAPSANKAWVNHYILRSADEALWKWARGQGDLSASQPETRRSLGFIAGTFLDLARPEQLVRDTRIQNCARGQAAVQDALLNLPGVAHAQQAITTQFSAALARNTGAFLAMQLPADMDPRVLAFRELVADQNGQA